MGENHFNSSFWVFRPPMTTNCLNMNRLCNKWSIQALKHKTQTKTDKIHVLTGVLREFRAMREERIWVKNPRYNEVRVITRYDCTAVVEQNNGSRHYKSIKRLLKCFYFNALLTQEYIGNCYGSSKKQHGRIPSLDTLFQHFFRWIHRHRLYHWSPIIICLHVTRVWQARVN